ncbi:MAG TPA: CoA-binding protein [Blastocatellia bacterium]|nr:CoA-binding protein [Blastocatellia bacterium]
MAINDPEVIDRMLTEYKTIAVVGLSSDASRASNSVSRYMQSHGYRIIPVNPNETSVLGEESYGRLEDIPDRIDLVDIFRRSEEAGQHVDEAIRLGARGVWLQEGVIDEKAARRALDAGLDVVMDLCILKEHIKRER